MRGESSRRERDGKGISGETTISEVKLVSTSAVLLVADLDRAVTFYRDQLGFDCAMHGDPPNFATTGRGEGRIFLALCDDEAVKRNVPNWRLVHNMWDVYIRVEGVDALYAELQERGAKIDYTIYDAPHGMREFGVQDPDGHDIGFGEPIDQAR